MGGRSHLRLLRGALRVHAALTVIMSLMPRTPACSTSSASRKAWVSVVLLSLRSAASSTTEQAKAAK
jgi:hypothetical protein